LQIKPTMVAKVCEAKTGSIMAYKSVASFHMIQAQTDKKPHRHRHGLWSRLHNSTRDGVEFVWREITLNQLTP
jgi:hypothetical protein